MSEKYYDEFDNEMSKEEFDQDRKELLAERFESMKNPDNRIPYEDLDYYLDELEKYWKKD
jgi:hypothetical protein